MKLARWLILCSIAVLGAFRTAAQPFGAPEPEFRVNAYTSGYQGRPVVAPYSLGGFVVAWYGDNEIAGQTARITVRRFGATLQTVGAEFHVGAFTTQQQFQPSIAGGLTAQFVISWFAPEGVSGVDVFAQRFLGGANLGAAIRVNTTTSDEQRVPSVAADGAGDFVVAWNSFNQGNSTYSVWGKRFSTAGTDLTPEFALGAFTTGEQVNPVVARNQAGRFVVAYQGEENGINAIFANRFTSTGFSAGAFNVSGTVEEAVYPAVAISPSGEFAVAWSAPDEDTLGVFAVLYSQYGYPHGTPFRINTYTTNDQSSPSIAYDSEENFVVVWHSYGQDGSGYGVFGQRFSGTGARQGGEFRLSVHTTAEQVFPRITATQFGDFIVTWGSAHAAAPDRDVYVRRLCANLAGDANADDSITVSDILYLINYLFAGGLPPQRNCDVDGSNGTNVSDILYLINYLFAGGPQPRCVTFVL